MGRTASFPKRPGVEGRKKGAESQFRGPATVITSPRCIFSPRTNPRFGSAVNRATPIHVVFVEK